MRPGDRKQRWESSCNIGGAIMLFIGGFFILGGITATKGGTFCYVWGAACIICAMFDFRSAYRGWKIKYEHPPWADKHDMIRRKHGLEPFHYKEPTERKGLIK